MIEKHMSSEDMPLGEEDDKEENKCINDSCQTN